MEALWTDIGPTIAQMSQAHHAVHDAVLVSRRDVKWVGLASN